MTRKQAELAAREIVVKAKNSPNLLPGLIADALMERARSRAEGAAQLLEMALRELLEHNADYHHRTSDDNLQLLREAIEEAKKKAD